MGIVGRENYAQEKEGASSKLLENPANLYHDLFDGRIISHEKVGYFPQRRSTTWTTENSSN
jgi:hypothetical protein